jgi:hypothetical protein
MSFLTRVGAALDAAKVRYALVGGYAVALHGAVRGTVDIDIILAWDRRTLRAAEQALQGLRLVSRLPITADEVCRFRDEYIRNRNLIAWTFYNPSDLTEQLDVVISTDLKGKKVQAIETADGTLRVLSCKDLIAMKRTSGRPQDLADIEALETLR